MAQTKKPRKRDNEAAVVAPPVRAQTEWTTDRLKSAMRQADAGNLSLAATVCEWILGDDRVMGALQARLDALFGLEPDFEDPEGDGRRTGAVITALRRDWFVGYQEAELSKIHCWGLLLGIGPARHNWKTRSGHGNRVLPFPRFWHPQHLRMTENGWVTLDSQSREIPIVAGDGEWILHMPFGEDRPHSSGLWRGLGMWVLVKEFARIDWLRVGEKGSREVIHSSEGSLVDQRKELAEAIQEAGAQGIVALPAGWDYKLVESSADTKAIYEAQIALANESIAILIRGGNLSTNTQGGSLAAAQQQSKTGDRAKLRFDAQTLTTTAHDQSVVWWAEFNYGNPNLAPYPRYDTSDPEDTAATATTVKTVAEGLTALENRGFEIDDNELIERFNLSFLKPRPLEKRIPPQGTEPPVEQQDKKLPKPGDKKLALRPGHFLASGASSQDNSGFIAGQLFVDALVDTTAPLAEQALQPTMDAILEELEAATDHEEFRARLRARYASLNPSEISELVYRAWVEGELAGRASVNQDS